MFLFSFDARSTKSNNLQQYAIIQCWVNFKDFKGSEFLAHKYIETLGWKIVREEYPAMIVRRNMFAFRAEDKIHNQCFDFAIEDGISHLCITYRQEK